MLLLVIIKFHNLLSLYYGVSYDCLDFCENLFLYAHSIDDIRDEDFDNIKSEDFEIFLLPATAWDIF
jgi:hypothetical protein